MEVIGKLLRSSTLRLPAARLPDFSWSMIPKPEKMYQMNTKCPKWSQSIPNGHKVSKMSVKYSKGIKISIFSNLSPYKIYPKWDFWLENKPSGNPEFAA
jgi:hypothetical protein